MGADPAAFLSHPWQCTVAVFDSVCLRSVPLAIVPKLILPLFGHIAYLLANFHIVEYCLAAVGLMCLCSFAFLSSKIHCFPLLDFIIFNDLPNQFSSKEDLSSWVSADPLICIFHDRICKYVQISFAVTSHMYIDTYTIACIVYILWTL